MATIFRLVPVSGAVYVAPVLLASACTQAFERRAANFEPIAVERAQFALMETERLDVRIRSFEPAPPPAAASAVCTLSDD